MYSFSPGRPDPDLTVTDKVLVLNTRILAFSENLINCDIDYLEIFPKCLLNDFETCFRYTNNR
jgi:hypothetical protein